MIRPNIEKFKKKRPRTSLFALIWYECRFDTHPRQLNSADIRSDSVSSLKTAKDELVEEIRHMIAGYADRSGFVREVPAIRHTCARFVS